MNDFMRVVLTKQLIQSKLEEIKKLRELATAISIPDISKERVAGGPQVQCRFAEIVDKLVDLEREILQEVDDYIEQEREMRNIINALPNPEWQLLMRHRYIEGLSFEDIAAEMNYSVRHVYNMRKDIFKYLETLH
jgi:DNA-directed RNA polymerase specialized sigma24 family protein